MLKKITWKLISNNKEEFSIEDDFCQYENSIITYNRDDGKNIVDIVNKIYKRETKEYIMEIDFKNNLCNFIFENKEKCAIDIESEFKIVDNNIELLYNFADEKKKIIISFKED